MQNLGYTENRFKEAFYVIPIFWFPSTILPKCYTWLYCKNPKVSDTQKFAVITLKVEKDGFILEQCIQNLQRELQTV